MGLNEQIEYEKFKTFWFADIYRQRFSEGSWQFNECWQAWKRQVLTDQTYREANRQWNPELAAASENAAYQCERCLREDEIGKEVAKRNLL